MTRHNSVETSRRELGSFLIVRRLAFVRSCIRSSILAIPPRRLRGAPKLMTQTIYGRGGLGGNPVRPAHRRLRRRPFASKLSFKRDA